ncbi:MAG: DUF6485 family protein [bacterium]
MHCELNPHASSCNCTYEVCERKGHCCKCLHYHRERNELPACFFPDDIEREYDRSVTCFIRMQKKR